MSRSFESYRPTPARLWIRYRPRRWPGASDLWTDWAAGTLGHPGRGIPELPVDLDRGLADVLYLPPVEPDLEPHRAELAAACVAAGTPVLLQRRAGLDGESVDGATEVWDLLPALLDGDRPELWEVPPGAHCVWPLVAGLTEADEVVAAGLERLAAAGADVVQAITLELSAPAKRRLAEAGDSQRFDRLFHAPRPSERDFARQAAARGFGSFLDRPLGDGSPRLSLRRRCAGELRLAADLYYRLGRPESESQKLLRAARWIDREDHDLAALAEEHNLEIVDWIDATSRGVIEELVGGGRSRLVASLVDEYTGAGA